MHARGTGGLHHIHRAQVGRVLALVLRHEEPRATCCSSHLSGSWHDSRGVPASSSGNPDTVLSLPRSPRALNPFKACESISMLDQGSQEAVLGLGELMNMEGREGRGGFLSVGM